MEEKKMKIQVGIIEVPPEGEKIPIEIEIPAKEVVDWVWADWSDESPTKVTNLVPAIGEQEIKRLKKEAFEKALAKNQQEWEEFRKNRSSLEDKKRLLKSLFGE